ncbi:MAG: cytochrome c oxidase assembly protein [Gammaproteobacteria bacterium]|nr:cytochrome c oxidase assembly protein [Gammaproteobacteria bacterium]
MAGGDDIRRSNRRLTLRLAAAAVAMFGFGYLLVPFYYLMCEVIGIGGRTADAVAAAPLRVDAGRTVTVELTGSVNQDAPWEFHPKDVKLQVQPGRLYTATFVARNLSDQPLTGQAIPSVAPGTSARYLKKTDCFCFRSQAFAPAETRELTVQFYLDPALPRHVDRLTLSYTLFLQPAVQG